VFYEDRHAEESARRVAGAFTTEAEARKLARELRQLADSHSFRYEVEPSELYKRSEDWRADPDDPPYGTVPGLNVATATLPELKGHRCRAISRISSVPAGGQPTTHGLEIGWMTGAHVQLGVARPGALLITTEPWASPGRSPLRLVDPAENPAGEREERNSQPVDDEDPLLPLIGERVHRFSVRENPDGSISAVELTFKSATLLIGVEGDEFLLDVAQR
jgi:hypothetical protein